MVLGRATAQGEDPGQSVHRNPPKFERAHGIHRPRVQSDGRVDRAVEELAGSGRLRAETRGSSDGLDLVHDKGAAADGAARSLLTGFPPILTRFRSLLSKRGVPAKSGSFSAFAERGFRFGGTRSSCPKLPWAEAVRSLPPPGSAPPSPSGSGTRRSVFLQPLRRRPTATIFLIRFSAGRFRHRRSPVRPGCARCRRGRGQGKS